MKNPLFIISYYANNKGTTDYLMDFLKTKGVAFYYLKHPLPEMPVHQSSLLFFDGNTAQEVAVFKSPRSFLRKLLFELSLNIRTTVKLRFKGVRTIVGFGSINAVSVLISKLLRAKVVFWGVDYSPKRFDSSALNRVYLVSETLACRFSNLVIQPNELQQQARIQKHKLKSGKSMVVPNGVTKLDDITVAAQKQSIRLLYIGSLTPHHGVLDFLKHAYGDFDFRAPLTIFGEGAEFAKTKEYVRQHNLDKLVAFMGSQPPAVMEEYVKKSPDKLIGIAPYKNDANSHVSFGDSLKLKEYVNLGMPFIASDAVKIDTQLQRLGRVYSSPQELQNILRDPGSLTLSPKTREQYLQSLDWSYVFTNNKLLEVLS